MDRNKLNWVDHADQLNRQRNWQQVRDDFYRSICFAAKTHAAYARAYGGGPLFGRAQDAAAAGEEQRERRITERALECRDASDFYNNIVIAHDAAIKSAFREGDAEEHRRLLNEANEVIRQMRQHTKLALSHAVKKQLTTLHDADIVSTT
jgi:hypothetical protein